MKKYLFLLFLFIIYLLICSVNDDKVVNVASYNKKYSTNTYILNFNNGINSKVFEDIIKNYEKEIYIYKINDTKGSCNNFNDCIKDIYTMNDYNFEINYIASGFKIDKIELISDYSIEKFLDDNNINYIIN